MAGDCRRRFVPAGFDGWRAAAVSALPVPVTRIRLTIPQGVLALCEQAAKRIKGGEAVWNGGLRDVLEQALQESGIPPELTVFDAARHFGILKNGTKRRKRLCGT